MQHTKNNTLIMFLCAIFVTLTIMMIPTIYADDVVLPTVEDLTIEASGTTVTVTWTSLNSADGYELQFTKDASFETGVEAVLIDNQHKTNYIIKETIAPNESYYFRIRAYTFIQDNTYYSEWSETYKKSYSLEKTYIKTQKLENEKIAIDWKIIKDCNKYQIQYSNSQEFLDVHTIDVVGPKSNCTIENTEPGVWYLRIRSVFPIGGVDYYSDWSNTKSINYNLTKTYIKTLSGNQNKITINWNAIDEINGYQIQWGTTPDLQQSQTIEIDDPNANLYYIENIQPGIYYAKIRTYKTINNNMYYSDWSNIKTINYSLSKTYLTNQYSSNNAIQIQWKSVANCDGYQVCWSAKEDFSDEMLETTQGADLSNMTLKMNTSLIPGTYWIKIRTYKIIDGQTYYSEWSNIKSVNFQFSKTYLTNQVVENNYLKLTWKNVGCYMYEVRYSQDENFSTYKTVTFAANKAKGETISKLISNENLLTGKYYIKIRAVYKVDKSYYTDWSNVKTVDYKLTKTYIKTLTPIEGRIDITWQTIENCSGYEIQYSQDYNMANSQTATMPDCEFDFYAFGDNCVPDATYYIRIRTYHVVGNQTCYSEWSNIKSAQCHLVKTYLTSQQALSDHILLKWKLVPSCDGYQIQYSQDPTFPENDGLVHISDPNTSMAQIKKLNSGLYYFRIRTIKYANGTYYCSDWSNVKSIAYVPKTFTTIQSIETNLNKTVVKWNTFLSVTGYELQYGSDPFFEKNTITENIEGNTIDSIVFDLLPGIYYFRIRTYKFSMDGTVYSEWSPIKIYKFEIQNVDFTSVDINNRNLLLTWNASKGGHGYHIEYSKDINFEFDVQTKQIVNTNTLEYTINDIEPGEYYVRIQAYKIINQQKYFSDWSESIVIVI